MITPATIDAHTYMREHLASIVRQVIFELGMYDGEDTKMLLSWAKDPMYHGFEPDPRNMAKLHDLPISVNFHPDAVGNVTDKVPLYISTLDPNGNATSSSISPFTPALTKRWPWLKCSGQIIVWSWRLDDFCKAHAIDHIDLIWMDVQGAERLVFEGAQEILKRTKLVWTEHDDGTLYKDSSTAKDILEILPGWKVIANTGSDMLLENPNAL